MNTSAHDWASPDPTQNMTLADAKKFGDALCGGLAVQFGEMYIRTTAGRIISESQLRANTFILPLPVNLYTHLAAANGQEINIAQFRATLQQAAEADDPTGTLCGILSQAMPKTDVPQQFTRIPAVQAVLLDALRTL